MSKSAPLPNPPSRPLVGGPIRHWRRERGLSQEALAHIAGIDRQRDSERRRAQLPEEGRLAVRVGDRRLAHVADGDREEANSGTGELIAS